MNLEQYLPWTATTAVYPKDREFEYLTLGLISELGELAAIFKRQIRDGVPLKPRYIKLEVGDILYYLARLHPQYSLWIRQAEDAYIGDARHAPAIIKAMCKRIESVTCLGRFFELLGCLQLTMQEVIDANVEKLSDRQVRGVLQGAGDER